jgi:hypothetical protein
MDSDTTQVMISLWEQERIQIRCTILDGQLVLRFSAQAYVGTEDLQRLARALDRRGWPARA